MGMGDKAAFIAQDASPLKELPYFKLDKRILPLIDDMLVTEMFMSSLLDSIIDEEKNDKIFLDEHHSLFVSLCSRLDAAKLNKSTNNEYNVSSVSVAFNDEDLNNREPLITIEGKNVVAANDSRSVLIAFTIMLVERIEKHKRVIENIKQEFIYETVNFQFPSLKYWIWLLGSMLVMFLIIVVIQLIVQKEIL